MPMPIIANVARARVANGSARDVLVSFDSNPFRIDATVPFAEADPAAWLSANVNAAQQAAWSAKAATQAAAGYAPEIPEGWTREQLSDVDFDELLRAAFKELWSELDAIRAASGMTARTNANRVQAIRARLNA